MMYYLSFIVVHVFSLVYSQSNGIVPQCNLCVDRFNWTHCDEAAKPKECSVELVNATHNYLSQFNPELSQTRSSDRQFRCFRLELEIDVSSVNVFIRGCTYDDTTFCEGWSANGAKAINCAICSTGVCERNATWDVLPVTSTTVDPSTSTTSVSSSTTAVSSSTTAVSSSTTAVSSSTTAVSSSTTTTVSSTAQSSSTVTATESTATKTTSTVGTTSTELFTTSSVSSTSPAASAHVINCTDCGSAESWEDCMKRSSTSQCTTAGVNKMHSVLRRYNPNLPVGNYSEFKCFTMKAKFRDIEHGVVQYGMGCTFASARFCTRSEWRNVDIMECSGTSLLNAANVISLMIVATLMMFV